MTLYIILNSAAIEWTVSALACMIAFLAVVAGFSYLNIKQNLKREIQNKDLQIKQMIMEREIEFEKKVNDRINKMFHLKKYKQMSRESVDLFQKKDYLNAFITQLECLSIFPDKHKYGVHVEVDKDTGMVMDYTNNVVAYGSALYGQLDKMDANDISKRDLEKIEGYLNVLYGDDIPKLFVKICDSIRSILKE